MDTGLMGSFLASLTRDFMYEGTSYRFGPLSPFLRDREASGLAPKGYADAFMKMLMRGSRNEEGLLAPSPGMEILVSPLGTGRPAGDYPGDDWLYGKSTGKNGLILANELRTLSVVADVRGFREDRFFPEAFPNRYTLGSGFKIPEPIETLAEKALNSSVYLVGDLKKLLFVRAYCQDRQGLLATFKSRTKIPLSAAMAAIWPDAARAFVDEAGLAFEHRLGGFESESALELFLLYGAEAGGKPFLAYLKGKLTLSGDSSAHSGHAAIALPNGVVYHPATYVFERKGVKYSVKEKYRAMMDLLADTQSGVAVSPKKVHRALDVGMVGEKINPKVNEAYKSLVQSVRNAFGLGKGWHFRDAQKGRGWLLIREK
jgi:hypothetical protein